MNENDFLSKNSFASDKLSRMFEDFADFSFN